MKQKKNPKNLINIIENQDYYDFIKKQLIKFNKIKNT